MKFISLLLAALLLGQAANTRASELFVGVELTPLNLWKARCNPFSCPADDKDGSSIGFSFHAGQWLEHTNEGKYGWEAGYDNLGSTSGASTYLLGPGCFLLCPTAVATWKHEATAVYLSAISGYTMNPGTLSGKIGIYRSTTRTTGINNGSAYSQQIARNGLMLGAGYESASVRKRDDGLAGIRQGHRPYQSRSDHQPEPLQILPGCPPPYPEEQLFDIRLAKTSSPRDGAGAEPRWMGRQTFTTSGDYFPQ